MVVQRNDAFILHLVYLHTYIYILSNTLYTMAITHTHIYIYKINSGEDRSWELQERFTVCFPARSISEEFSSGDARYRDNGEPGSGSAHGRDPRSPKEKEDKERGDEGISIYFVRLTVHARSVHRSRFPFRTQRWSRCTTATIPWGGGYFGWSRCPGKPPPNRSWRRRFAHFTSRKILVRCVPFNF